MIYVIRTAVVLSLVFGVAPFLETLIAPGWLSFLIFAVLFVGIDMAITRLFARRSDQPPRNTPPRSDGSP